MRPTARSQRVASLTCADVEDARKAQADPGKDSHSKAALDLIGQLYGIEREIKTATAQERLCVLQARSAPILTELKAWLDTLVELVLPQSALGRAIHYALGQYPKLTRFLSHPEIAHVENAIRPFCVARRNWLLADTIGSAHASARLYSLIETVRANGIELHLYLTHLFTELPKATIAEHFEALLPWRVALANTGIK